MRCNDDGSCTESIKKTACECSKVQEVKANTCEFKVCCRHAVRRRTQDFAPRCYFACLVKTLIHFFSYPYCRMEKEWAANTHHPSLKKLALLKLAKAFQTDVLNALMESQVQTRSGWKVIVEGGVVQTDGKIHMTTAAIKQ